METEDIKKKVKLGIFVTGGIIVFLLAVFLLGKGGSLFNKTFSISAVFTNVEGLKKGDNIWLSGVKVGTVKHVAIISEAQVMVELNVNEDQNIHIKKDATAFVGSDGLVGNKIVVIKPGKGTELVHPGDTINSFAPTNTQQLLDLADEVGTSIGSIMDDMHVITAQLKNGKGVLGELIMDKGPISDDVRLTMSSLKKSAEQSTKLINQANATLAEVKNGDGLVAKLLTDTSYTQSFEATLQNIGAVGANAKQMSEDLQGIIDQMNSGDNALSMVLSDTVTAKKLETTLNNLKSASFKLDENMEALQHNFLFRRYFRKQAKEEEKNQE